MPLPIILDCDPGHDDAIALILALASPELELKAVIPPQQATKRQRKRCAMLCAF